MYGYGDDQEPLQETVDLVEVRPPYPQHPGARVDGHPAV